MSIRTLTPAETSLRLDELAEKEAGEYMLMTVEPHDSIKPILNKIRDNLTTIKKLTDIGIIVNRDEMHQGKIDIISKDILKVMQDFPKEREIRCDIFTLNAKDFAEIQDIINGKHSD